MEKQTFVTRRVFLNCHCNWLPNRAESARVQAKGANGAGADRVTAVGPEVSRVFCTWNDRKEDQVRHDILSLTDNATSHYFLFDVPLESLAYAISFARPWGATPTQIEGEAGQKV
jgi:hypothetical protein